MSCSSPNPLYDIIVAPNILSLFSNFLAMTLKLSPYLESPNPNTLNLNLNKSLANDLLRSCYHNLINESGGYPSPVVDTKKTVYLIWVSS